MKALRPLFVLLVVGGALGIAFAVFTAVSGAVSSEPPGALDIILPMLGGMVALALGIGGLLVGMLGGTVDRKKVGADARAVPATIVEVRSGNARERYSRRALRFITAELHDGGLPRTVTTKQWVSELGALTLAEGDRVTAFVSARDPEKVWIEA